jgi:phage tail-like protein
MAKFANPRKKFNWSIQISPDPINPFLFQKVTLPDSDIEKVAHGDTNHDINTAGRVTYGNIVCEKLAPSDQGDSYLWAWHDTCQSSVIGGGAPPQIYKKVITIVEMAEDGVTILNTWIAEGVWPTSLPGIELDRMASENTVENVEFAIDTLSKV